ncbi:MAG: hypothetical protein OZSIB_0227 [Candidatus Ozemobacter sibiricus]|uniref:Uncharacterized protein n=1 Tax=Candidatus Ozemobacter sibiricus TaxID=2268124 RepID=A0A367ZMV4_9BACT|nr:MAG: hypothetical protein OZSIB_0227 [Candidatus Ozemobacter sibiricus]
MGRAVDDDHAQGRRLQYRLQPFIASEQGGRAPPRGQRGPTLHDPHRALSPLFVGPGNPWPITPDAGKPSRRPNQRLPPLWLDSSDPSHVLCLSYSTPCEGERQDSSFLPGDAPTAT